MQKIDDNVVARVFDVKSGSRTYANAPFAYSSGSGFVRTPASTGGNVTEVDVPGVVLRMATHHRTFDIVRKDVPIWKVDIVKAAPDTTIVLELLVGARLGIKRGGIVRMITNDEAESMTAEHWHRITLTSGGLYAKFHKDPKPLTIQTRGGVMGIKG